MHPDELLEAVKSRPSIFKSVNLHTLGICYPLSELRKYLLAIWQGRQAGHDRHHGSRGRLTGRSQRPSSASRALFKQNIRDSGCHSHNALCIQVSSGLENSVAGGRYLMVQTSGFSADHPVGVVRRKLTQRRLAAASAPASDGLHSCTHFFQA
jgi:hypothetical protein